MAVGDMEGWKVIKRNKNKGGWQATLSQARPARAEASQAGSGSPGQARESAKSSGIHFSNRTDWADMTMGYRNIIVHHVFLILQNSTPVGFEPTRGDPIGLAGRRLNRSAKVSLQAPPSVLQEGTHLFAL